MGSIVIPLLVGKLGLLYSAVDPQNLGEVVLQIVVSKKMTGNNDTLKGCNLLYLAVPLLLNALEWVLALILVAFLKSVLVILIKVILVRGIKKDAE